ncbi:hypothetical protein [Clostridium sp. JS66]|uniref:hypothetical protein n=1 Tax=Clostridium sp. JS66 TaxID=3064705 RepID=UPI00298D732F|nr:hypothetical protein [Clostridium sp. JS66]WPC39893.1 hypothetical protein Q6H37_18505 [Clostridium sp. JS66]
MDKSRPLGTTLIGYCCILNAIVTILMPFTAVMELFGLQSVPENVVKILVSITIFIIAYGYLSLKEWSYWPMVAYNVYFLVVNILAYQQYQKQQFCVSIILSIIAVSYILMKKRYFYNRDFSF